MRLKMLEVYNGFIKKNDELRYWRFIIIFSDIHIMEINLIYELFKNNESKKCQWFL